MAGASPAIDVAKLFEQHAIQSDADRAQVAELGKSQEQMDASVIRETEAIREEAANNVIVTSGIENILLERSNKNKKAAADYGVNQDAQNYVGASMGQAIVAKHRAVEASGADIQARLGANFIDDPLSWIYDRFALPFDVAAHNANVASLDRDIETNTQLGALADAQVKRNNAIDAGTTEEIMRAKSKQLLAAAEVKVANAEQTAIKNNVQIGSVRLAAGQQEFTNFLMLQRAQIDLQQLRIQQASLEESKKDRELRREQLKLVIAERDEKAESRLLLQKNLDQTTGVLGMRRLTVLEFERMPQQLRVALESAMVDPNIAQGRLGHDTITSLEVANSLNAPLTPQLQDLKTKLVNLTSTIQAKDPTWAAKKPDQKATAYQKGIDESVKTELSNIPDTGGMFSPPPLKAMGQIPAVAETVLWKSTFAGMAGNPAAPLKSQQVYDTALELVARGNIPLEQAAAEISTIYKSAVSANYTDRDYNRFALRIPEKLRDTYKTSVNTTGSGSGAFFSEAKSLDLTNETAVRNALMRGMMIRKTREGIQPPVLP